MEPAAAESDVLVNVGCWVAAWELPEHPASSAMPAANAANARYGVSRERLAAAGAGSATATILDPRVTCVRISTSREGRQAATEHPPMPAMDSLTRFERASRADEQPKIRRGSGLRAASRSRHERVRRAPRADASNESPENAYNSNPRQLATDQILEKLDFCVCRRPPSGSQRIQEFSQFRNQSARWIHWLRSS